MGFGNYDEVKCPSCGEMVEGTVWINKLRKAVCHSCKNEWEKEHPFWRSDDALDRLVDAEKRYFYAKKEYEDLMKQGK